MKKYLLQSVVAALLTSAAVAQYDAGQHTFSKDGNTITDKILKYDSEEEQVTLENNGRHPLKTFSPADQEYIIHWNQVAGFMSTMRFKMDIAKSNWARMKHEQTITPFYMDAIQIPGKKTPNHRVIMVDDYEEYNVIYMEAEGYSITLRNQNFFPIENLTVESKVYYEQENYTTPDSLFVSSESSYTDTVETNKVRFLSESIPIIVPREEVTMHSECAIIVDHQVDRNALVTTSEDEDEEDDESDDSEEDEEDAEETIEGFGDWDNHGRRRKGKVIGVWFRIGIKGLDGEMIWREAIEPTSLTKKYTWEGGVIDKDAE
ncbi:hypothetical protein PDESU_03938 [Pontiella desulfatans]|uniref:Uncharacterized protein n=1 Tax=Pontiella desulfatans TaxID=2750659 RepID=A0A6C2U609_PONDE|nr:hypothetical protein [Pontiella desulfatans]VGO15355.1 hypothetical protein PDESU_03938 [Pontiella desulfatans]